MSAAEASTGSSTEAAESATSAAGGDASTPAHAAASAAGTRAESNAAEAPTTSPAPLTSLSSLLGGDFEGGAACAADGTCD